MQSLSMYAVLIGCVMGTVVTNAQDVLYAQPGSSITIQNNASVYIQGNISFANTSILDHQGMLYVNRNTVTGMADWLDQSNTGYYYGPGTVIFNSSGTQTATSPNQFGSIEVRNAGLNLGSTISANRWLLHTGVVHTGIFRAIALSTEELAVDATVTNTNFTVSWFNGTLRRHITPATVNSYLFPVGGLARVNRAQLFNLNTNPINANYIDASFVPKAGSDAGLFHSADGLLYTAINNDTVNNGDVWNLTPDVGSLTGHFDLRLYFNGFPGFPDNLFGILRREIGSSNGADWIAPVGSTIPALNQPGRLYTDGYARRNAVPIMGQFGIASGTVVSLPIHLLDFNAVRQNDKEVLLTWKATTDAVNESFVIERKLSTESEFQSVGVIASMLNGSGFKEYKYNDLNSDKGKSWYRLKMIDQSGKVTYSKIRIVNGVFTSAGVITIAPNPSRGQFSILVNNIQKTSHAYLYDEKGSLLKSFVIEINTPINVTGLPAGTYFVVIPQLKENDKIFRKKIVVVH